MSEEDLAKSDQPKRMSARTVALRVLGLAIGAASVALCTVALVHQWETVRSSIVHANLTLIVLSFVVATVGMAGLGVLWWRCLHSFGEFVQLRATMAWYFAGELGKYIPGGIWPVLGRGELAFRRGGVSRSTGYVTTLISYGAMCVAAAAVCGGLALFLALTDQSLKWGWAIVALVPLGLIATHPFVFDRVLRAASSLTRRSITLTAPSWGRMLSLIATAAPTWVLVGLSSVLITRALGYHGRLAQVAFAAVAAWIIGFLAVPVPAGAGLRELIFVELSGLSSGRAVAVAAGARLVLLCVDGGTGIVALIQIRMTSPVPVPRPADRLAEPEGLDRAEVASAEG